MHGGKVIAANLAEGGVVVEIHLPISVQKSVSSIE